jgi:diketogulonate reductase-like aldo/keto reductase
VILKLAQEHGVSPATICLRWSLQKGAIPIPFSVKREQYEASLKAAFGPELSPEAMEAIQGIDQGCRLIKGQVFLWPGAKDWEELWN